MVSRLGRHAQVPAQCQTRPVSRRDLEPGIYESLLTRALAERIGALDSGAASSLSELANAEASDRLSRHLAAVVARVIEAQPEEDRAKLGVAVVERLIEQLAATHPGDVEADFLAEPAQVLRAIVNRKPDGSLDDFELPLTPLLDTTLLTNARGEPNVGHEVRAEIHSSDSIDVVMAFVRWSGLRPMFDALRRHCESGKRVRLVTTTYTNSTELRALQELERVGAEVRVSYDTTTTRLHAKAWLFHRASGFSTAYIGSSNLTHSAMRTGLEWNVRVSGARNPDVIAKMRAVFDAYWEGGDFLPFDADEFLERTKAAPVDEQFWLPPTDIVLMPFQERLLEQIAASRVQGHHRNLLVSATGTGKTVMAAVDYVRLRSHLPRARLLFVAHRKEILDQSRNTFRHALRDAGFGEFWVDGTRPDRYEHVFASIQSLNAAGLQSLDPAHFDVVIVDEFHHAAAPSYQQLLEHARPIELLGMTATPERADERNVTEYFDGRIAAELRVWDAIDAQYLVPFAYFGIYDGADLQAVPWSRSLGYNSDALTNVFTADHVWSRRVLEQVHNHVDDPRSMRALGFCVSVAHARFVADRFNEAGIPAVAICGETPSNERAQALRDLRDGTVNVVFTVDLFNEGVDVPNADTLLLLRPTESATLFLQQLGRGLRRAPDKPLCTVLDFVGNHRREFRFDRKFRALLGSSRTELERDIKRGFPFLPSGCHMELDAVSSEVVLRSLRQAIPSGWRSRCGELRALGDVSMAGFLRESGLDLDDIYAGNHSWSEMRRAAGLPTGPAGPQETALLRAVGRMTHIDDERRIDGYRRILAGESTDEATLSRLAQMLVGSLPAAHGINLEQSLRNLRDHPQVCAELLELLDLLASNIDHVHAPLAIPEVPLEVHASYTRAEILSAFGVTSGLTSWVAGVRWFPEHQTDVLTITLDKSAGSFSPTTRYRDYAIGPDLIHWESQSTTALAHPQGRRYVTQAESGTRVVIFARHTTNDRAFWCLGTANYVSHEGERPIAITWRLDHRLPGDLYASFAAAVA